MGQATGRFAALKWPLMLIIMLVGTPFFIVTIDTILSILISAISGNAKTTLTVDEISAMQGGSGVLVATNTFVDAFTGTNGILIGGVDLATYINNLYSHLNDAQSAGTITADQYSTAVTYINSLNTLLGKLADDNTNIQSVINGLQPGYVNNSQAGILQGALTDFQALSTDINIIYSYLKDIVNPNTTALNADLSNLGASMNSFSDAHQIGYYLKDTVDQSSLLTFIISGGTWGPAGASVEFSSIGLVPLQERIGGMMSFDICKSLYQFVSGDSNGDNWQQQVPSWLDSEGWDDWLRLVIGGFCCYGLASVMFTYTQSAIRRTFYIIGYWLFGFLFIAQGINSPGIFKGWYKKLYGRWIGLLIMYIAFELVCAIFPLIHDPIINGMNEDDSLLNTWGLWGDAAVFFALECGFVVGYLLASSYAETWGAKEEGFSGAKSIMGNFGMSMGRSMMFAPYSAISSGVGSITKAANAPNKAIKSVLSTFDSKNGNNISSTLYQFKKKQEGEKFDAMNRQNVTAMQSGLAAAPHTRAVVEGLKKAGIDESNIQIVKDNGTVRFKDDKLTNGEWWEGHEGIINLVNRADEKDASGEYAFPNLAQARGFSNTPPPPPSAGRDNSTPTADNNPMDAGARRQSILEAAGGAGTAESGGGAQTSGPAMASGGSEGGAAYSGPAAGVYAPSTYIPPTGVASTFVPSVGTALPPPPPGIQNSYGQYAPGVVIPGSVPAAPAADGSAVKWTAPVSERGQAFLEAQRKLIAENKQLANSGHASLQKGFGGRIGVNATREGLSNFVSGASRITHAATPTQETDKYGHIIPPPPAFAENVVPANTSTFTFTDNKGDTRTGTIETTHLTDNRTLTQAESNAWKGSGDNAIKGADGKVTEIANTGLKRLSAEAVMERDEQEMTRRATTANAFNDARTRFAGGGIAAYTANAYESLPQNERQQALDEMRTQLANVNAARNELQAAQAAAQRSDNEATRRNLSNAQANYSHAQNMQQYPAFNYRDIPRDNMNALSIVPDSVDMGSAADWYARNADRIHAGTLANAGIPANTPAHLVPAGAPMGAAASQYVNDRQSGIASVGNINRNTNQPFTQQEIYNARRSWEGQQYTNLTGKAAPRPLTINQDDARVGAAHPGEGLLPNAAGALRPASEKMASFMPKEPVNTIGGPTIHQTHDSNGNQIGVINYDAPLGMYASNGQDPMSQREFALRAGLAADYSNEINTLNTRIEKITIEDRANAQQLNQAGVDLASKQGALSALNTELSSVPAELQNTQNNLNNTRNAMAQEQRTGLAHAAGAAQSYRTRVDADNRAIADLQRDILARRQEIESINQAKQYRQGVLAELERNPRAPGAAANIQATRAIINTLDNQVVASNTALRGFERGLTEATAALTNDTHLFNTARDQEAASNVRLTALRQQEAMLQSHLDTLQTMNQPTARQDADKMRADLQAEVNKAAATEASLIQKRAEYNNELNAANAKIADIATNKLDMNLYGSPEQIAAAANPGTKQLGAVLPKVPDSIRKNAAEQERLIANGAKLTHTLTPPELRNPKMLPKPPKTGK